MRLRKTCPFRLLGVPLGSGIALSAVLATSNPAAFLPCPGCVDTGERNQAGFTNFGKICRALSSSDRRRTTPYVRISPSLLFPYFQALLGKFRHVSFPLAFFRRGSVFPQRKQRCQQSSA